MLKTKTGFSNPFQIQAASAPFALEFAHLRAVEALRLNGRQSRTGIADLIGYSPSKMTSVVNDLIEQGILEEAGDSVATGGRRARTIDFNPNFGYFVAATVEPVRLDIALVDFCGNIRVRRMLPVTPDHGPQTILNLVCDFILERLDKLNIALAKIYGFGLTTPVPVDNATGTLFESSDLPGWGGYQIDSHIREVFPYGVVVIEKDANAMALGELRKSANTPETFVFLKLDVPVSAGVMIDGRIYRGTSGRAGDIIGLSGSDADSIGRALAALVSFADPAAIIVGGSQPDAEAQIFAVLSRHILGLSGQPRRVERSALGAEAAMSGIIARVAESVFVPE